MSDREHGEVSEYERQYPDGSDPVPLDVIDVPLIKPKPESYQTEDWLLDPRHYWEKRGRVSWEYLDQLTDPVADLWTNGMSTYHGQNDKMDIAGANQLDHSLRLVKLSAPRLSVFAPGAEFDDSKRRVQACFVHNGKEYRLWVTDPKYERDYLRRGDGKYELGECFVTVSIGQPFRGHVYKLVAAIIQPTDGGKMKDGGIFSIGHSTHGLEEFVRLLEKHRINVVADVRSRPFSRFKPHFNRENIAKALRDSGIRYAFFGRELGARPDDPSCYDSSGKVQYAALASRKEFRQAMARLLKGAVDHRIALMCAEKEPLDCHRTILVSRELSKRTCDVRHIHYDGSLETHAAALERLRDMEFSENKDLFTSEDNLLARALKERELKIAYRKTKAVTV
ncbi:MAG: DUF488 domain-containing protein [Hyphomonadaceae bacterium]|nr:DUF488 domain-containing protein [Hyphomonadaceae bacterium]